MTEKNEIIEEELENEQTNKEEEGTIQAKFIDAPEVENFSKDLMFNHHKHLIDAKIKFSFRTKTWSKTSDVVKFSEYHNYIHGYHFGIVINLLVWNAYNEKQRLALLDHLFSHCFCEEKDDGSLRWSKESHYVEEFPAVVRRNGLYTAELEILHQNTIANEDN